MTAVSRPLPLQTQLRPLNILRDLPAVANLVEACFASTMDDDGRRTIQQMRRASQDHAFLRWAVSAVDTVSMPLTGFVWEEGGELIGNVSMIPYRHARRKYYLVANVAVREGQRGRGIGRMLTQAALEYARSRGAHETWLHVRDDNPGAIRLYQDLGFTELARRTTWQAAPDRHLPAFPSPGPVRRRIRRDWTVEQGWLRRLYPPLLEWYQPMPWLSLRPGLGPAAYRFLLDSEFRHWSLGSRERPLACLAWQGIPGHSDRLWAAVPPEGSASALTALLLHARRQLTWREKLVLDFPSGELTEALQGGGFLPHRTLLWMKAAETPAVPVRTSS